MKVKIKDLRPNPFRDMENYPIDEEKIESLINSIDQTGFWDNILGRKKTDKIEIAYGHHRLVAIQKIFQPDDFVDIPIKELNDETMIRIMANENYETWGTGPKIIYETIRVTKKFLEGHPNILMSLSGITERVRLKNYKIGAKIIAEFLGKNWSRSRVEEALKGLKSISNREADKEAIETFPTMHSAHNFIKAVKRYKTVTPRQQKRAATRIIERQDFSEWGMYSVLFEEKYPKGKKTEEEQRAIKFKNYLIKCTKEIRDLNGTFITLMHLREELKPDFKTYPGSIEAMEFDGALRLLISSINDILGKAKKKKEEEKTISKSIKRLKEGKNERF